jgi:isochorismate synthase
MNDQSSTMIKTPSFTHITTLSEPELDQQQAITAFYQAPVQTQLPVALWRYPHEAVPQALVDLSGRAEETKIDFECRTPGFAFAPFINEGGHATLFLKAGITLDGQHLPRLRETQTTHSEKEWQNQTAFLAAYQSLIERQPALAGWSKDVPVTTERPHFSTQTEFCQLVEEAVHYIRSTDIRKVVASRATETPLPTGFHPVTTFEKLCERYPHAFISLVSIPNLGTWIGASPETLLTIKTGKLKTVALAGTQAYRADIPLGQVSWGAKEIEEQALVGDYIRHFFRQLNLAEVIEEGPHTVRAGNIVHLQTKFTIKLAETGLLRLGNQILDELHPTSAVCGMPRKEALSFILEKELYDRAFYSGFLGPVHVDEQSQLYVNLRCMQLTPASAILYVGAGITQDSVPQLEWQETILKSQTLLPVLATGSSVG